MLAKIAFNSILGLFAIFFWLKFVNLEDVKTTLLTVKPLLLLPVFITLWASISIRAFRLKVFLQPIIKIKSLEVILLNGVSALLNFLIPIRAGDITRGIYLGRTYKVPVPKTLTWIFIDRFIDILVLLGLVPILLMIVPNRLGTQVGVYALILSGILLIIAYAMTYQPQIAKKLLYFLSKLLVFNGLKKHFLNLSIHMLESFELLNRSIKSLGYIIFITIMAYVFDGLTIYLVFLSLGVDIPYIKTFLAQFLSALTFLIPAAPGYVGSAEASALVVFSFVLGIDQNLASSMVLIYHALLAIFIIGYGIFCLYALNLNPFSLLKRVSTHPSSGGKEED